MKKLYIFAGVNGAGKSTFYVNQLYKDGFFGARINSDEIVKEFGNWQSPKDQNRAGKIALKLRKSYLERGIDFNIETTLSGHGIVKFIGEAKAKGYYITLYYVGLDSVELSKQRVAIRAAKNGHSIDEAVLERRYKQSFDNLAVIAPLCDTIYFFDNSTFIKDEQDQQLENLELLGKKQGSTIQRNTNKKVLWFDDICEKIPVDYSAVEEIKKEMNLKGDKMAIYVPATLNDLKELVWNENINLGDIDVSNITDMGFLFKESPRTDFSGIENWDVSNVTNMEEIFYSCLAFNHDISSWDVSNVTKIHNAFAYTKFNQDLSKWNLKNVENAHNTDPFLGNNFMKQDFKPKPFDKPGFSNNNINKLRNH